MDSWEQAYPAPCPLHCFPEQVSYWVEVDFAAWESWILRSCGFCSTQQLFSCQCRKEIDKPSQKLKERETKGSGECLSAEQTRWQTVQLLIDLGNGDISWLLSQHSPHQQFTLQCVVPLDHELCEGKDHICFVDYRLSRVQPTPGCLHQYCLIEWTSAVLLFREADQEKRQVKRHAVHPAHQVPKFTVGSSFTTRHFQPH